MVTHRHCLFCRPVTNTASMVVIKTWTTVNIGFEIQTVFVTQTTPIILQLPVLVVAYVRLITQNWCQSCTSDSAGGSSPASVVIGSKLVAPPPLAHVSSVSHKWPLFGLWKVAQPLMLWNMWLTICSMTAKDVLTQTYPDQVKGSTWGCTNLSPFN